MGGFSFRSYTFMVFIAFLVWSSSFDTCIARRGKHWRQSRVTSASLSKKKGKNHGGGSSSHYHNGGSKLKPKQPPSHKAPLPHPPASKPPKKDTPSTSPIKGSAIFNVLDFGAKADGKSDDTKAFQAAWAAACKVEASTMLVPSEYVFLVGPVSFSGPY